MLKVSILIFCHINTPVSYGVLLVDFFKKLDLQRKKTNIIFTPFLYYSLVICIFYTNLESYVLNVALFSPYGIENNTE